ncbi:primosomal protein N' [Candidatus Binatia bacterium]|nr:primosomal protein N' [Candidatus Binatia bacterium]
MSEQGTPPDDRAPVCRVAIVPAAGRTEPLDYAIDPPLRGKVRPGMRVLVPLGARRSLGIVTDLLDASQHPRLRSVIETVDSEPVFDDKRLLLCRWIADYYLCPLAEVFGAALPGSLRVGVQRLLVVSTDGRDPATLPADARAVIDHLCTRGPASMEALAEHCGGATAKLIAHLRRGGWVRVEERLEPTAGPTRRLRFYRVTADLDADTAQRMQRSQPGRYAIYAYLHRHPLGRAATAELNASFPNAAAKLRALIAARLVAAIDEEVYREVLPEAPPADRPVTLTAPQAEAVDTISAVIGRAYQPFLLWGVTGSGKTEVYLRSVARCLDAGLTALALVPEISLTHQLVARLRARFGNRVAVLHSALSEGERWDEWRKIQRGEVEIVVGARSAVFAPLPRLGLVVVDEEHDSAYKQDDGIRYNGRDVAVVRARLSGCPIVLGSATPAIETFHNGRSGRYAVLELPARVAARPLPAVDLVDLRRGGKLGRVVLVSSPLAAALKANLAVRGQSLLFLNRRGFANFLQCVQCGDALACPNCSVTLTWHRRRQALRCHHCDHTIPPPTSCPSCGGLSLSAWGAGTEQVEAALRALVPGARVGRMDRDTTARKGSQQRILEAWERQEYDILVGTQMITKGHDIPGVTLVGVLLADQALNFPDFRAAERTFQLLTQVAGRAGRGDRPGRVIVQTLQPEHYSLTCAQQHDYAGFAEVELGHRRELGYPPFSRFVLIRCEGANPQATEAVARACAEHARRVAGNGADVLGPTPAPIERLRGRQRWHLLIRSRTSTAARRAAAAAREASSKKARSADVRVLVDVDPYAML